MKKFIKLLAVMMATVFCVSVYACDGCGGLSSKKIKRDENTIYIRAFKAGYGTKYLEELISKYNTLYEGQYKAELLAPSNTMQGAVAQKEMATNDDWADVYFTSATSNDALVNNKDYGTLILDLEEDVWQKPAIRFDGTEESVTIASKFNMEVNPESATVDGHHYSMYASVSVGGMIVNTKKLQSYGLSLPKTSNELINCFDQILCGNEANGNKSSSETNQYPLTYLAGENGYHTHLVNAWVAQYEGADWWEQFWGFIDENGNERVSDGYKMYEAKGIEEMVKEIYRSYDANFATPNAKTNTIDTAHAEIISDTTGAVFMADGDWAYNEMIKLDSNLSDKLAFINIPVISALGVKLFGTETAYNFDEDKCDEVLSYIISKSDEGKTATEIKGLCSSEKGWTIEESDVIKVMKARGVYCARSLESNGGIMISNKTANKQACFNLLRMFASDDYAKVYAQTTNSLIAYATDFSSLKDNAYFKSYSQILSREYSKGVWTIPTDLRFKLNQSVLLPVSGLFFVTKVTQENVTAYALTSNGGYEKEEDDSVYFTEAEKKFNADKEGAKNDWSKWLKNAGINN